MKILFTPFLLLLNLTIALAQPAILSSDSLIINDTTEGSSSPVLPPHSNTAKVGPKVVFWIHGLAGSNVSWEHVQMSTEDQTGSPVPGYPVRDVYGYAFDYSPHETLNIHGLASKVNIDYLETWRKATPRRDTLDVKKNFVIAHSQGGILSRAIRYKNLKDPIKDPWQFGAMATFNSPHGGTSLFNESKSDGRITKWINDGCAALTAAEFTSLVNSNKWLTLLISPQMIKEFSDVTCTALEKTVLPLLINGIRKPVLESYGHGAAHLKTLDSIAALDTIQTVLFYGVEEDPVLWRTLNSMTYFQDDSPGGHPLTGNPFGLDEDDKLPRLINNSINSYNLAMLLELIQATILESYLGGSIFYSKSIRKHREKADIYASASNWLATANQQWKYFIGARKDTFILKNYECLCYGYGREFRWDVNNPADCKHTYAKYCETKPVYDRLVFEEPSDGVVPVSSQKAYPSKIKPIPLEKTNHMQARNATTTRIGLNRLFNGLYGSEFELDEK